jgi:CHU_C Type IX secretion signal domain
LNTLSLNHQTDYFYNMKAILTLLILFCFGQLNAQQPFQDTCVVTIPNVLSQNSEQAQQLVYSNCPFTYFELAIYNRWGQELLKMRDYNPNYVLDWEAKEKDAPKWDSGTYAYKLTYSRYGDIPITQSGFITIIRK